MSHLLPGHQKKSEPDYWFEGFAVMLFIPFWGAVLLWLWMDSVEGYFLRGFAIFNAVVWFVITLSAGRNEAKQGAALYTGFMMGSGIVGYVLGIACVSLFTSKPKPVSADELAEVPSISGTFAGTFYRDPYITNPRGATLVLGPSGSGKTSLIIEPTVSLATGPVITSSVKWEVLFHTAAIRSKRGRIWALDLGGGVPADVTRVKWSPAYAVTGWDSARVIANEWSSPYQNSANYGPWVNSATDWLTVLLFAGRHVPLAHFAIWCRESEGALSDVENTIRGHMAGPGDIESRLALSTLRGLQSIPERERVCIGSTLRRLTSIYNSAAVLSDHGEVFEPARFIHTSDTLYIAASSEEQNASAGLIAALLGAITREQKRAFNENRHSEWLNLVVDGAASVACPALDTWASQFGGQGISLTVGLQDLSQARAAWPGVNFLGLFPSTILLPGIRDEQTLHTFSSIAGEFDRQLISTSESVIRPDSWTQNNDVHRSTSTNYRTEKSRVVPIEAIAQMSQGECMVWEGSTWKYVGTHPWGGEYFTGYVEKVPQQWREAIPSKTLLSKVTDKPGDEILRQAAQIDAENEGRRTHRNG